jgi:hypothetical protein
MQHLSLELTPTARQAQALATSGTRLSPVKGVLAVKKPAATTLILE